MPLPSYPLGGPLMSNPQVFSITDELQKTLDNLPAKEPKQSHSRLEPFRAFLLRWRREGRTYRDIQQILAVHCNVTVTHETLRRFILKRSRPRNAQTAASEIDQPTMRPLRQVSIPEEPTGGSVADRSPEERAAARAALRAAYEKPVFPRQETEPLFVYDPGQRIRNLNNEGEK